MGLSPVKSMMVGMGLLISTVPPASGAPGTIRLSESSYVKIQEFAGWYHPDAPGDIQLWRGFLSPAYDLFFRSTPTVEAKVVDFRTDSSSPSPRTEDNALLFDFHQGYADVGEYARGVPVGFLGEEPWYHIEFDWISDLAIREAGNVCIQCAVQPFPSQTPHVLWQFWPSAGMQSGHVAVEAGSRSNLSFSVIFRPIPEPSVFVGLAGGLLPLAWQMLRRRV